MKKNNNIDFQAAEIEITYKHKVKPSQMFQIKSSEDASKFVRNLFDEDQIEHREEGIVLFLNRANKVMGYMKVGIGGLSGCIVDPIIIFQACLKANAITFIFAHNHPSGNLKPSESDIEFTRKLREGSKLLDIKMLDHFIVTSEAYYSFMDEGMMI